MRLVRSLGILISFVVLFSLDTSLSAQTRANNSGTGGISIIKGQIFVPGNNRADGSVMVRLQSITFGELSLMTDQSGGFAFGRLAAGTYTLVVDAGEAFEIYRESVTIDPEVQGTVPHPPVPKTYTIPVYLQVKHHSSERTGVVNAKLAQVPKDALKHYDRGLDLEQSAKAEEALTEFKQAVAVHPPFSAAYLEMGKIYLATRRMDDAITALNMAARYEPNDFDTTLDYGIALYGKGDFAGAEPELNKAAVLNTTAVTPHYYLGLLFIQTKKLEKAQTELEMAKQLKGNKNFPLLHRYLGGVYVARNLNKQAVAELETYLQLAPGTKDADRIRQTIADLKNKTN